MHTTKPTAELWCVDFRCVHLWMQIHGLFGRAGWQQIYCSCRQQREVTRINSFNFFESILCFDNCLRRHIKMLQLNCVWSQLGITGLLLAAALKYIFSRCFIVGDSSVNAKQVGNLVPWLQRHCGYRLTVDLTLHIAVDVDMKLWSKSVDWCRLKISSLPHSTVLDADILLTSNAIMCQASRSDEFGMIHELQNLSAWQVQKWRG